MIKISEQNLMRGINEKYLKDIDLLVTEIKTRLRKKNREDLLSQIEQDLESMRRFVYNNSSDVREYKNLKAKADQAKINFISIVGYLNLIEGEIRNEYVKEIIKRLDKQEVEIEKLKAEVERGRVERGELKAEIKELKERQDKFEAEQERGRVERGELKAEIKELKERQEKDREDKNELKNTTLKGFVEQNTRMNNQDEKIKELRDEVVGIKARIEEVKTGIGEYVQQNKDSIERKIEAALKNQSGVPDYTPSEYQQVMQILSMMEKLPFANGQEVVSVFQERINDALSGTMPKIFGDIVSGVLSGKNFKLNAQTLVTYDGGVYVMLMNEVYNQVRNFCPSSELVAIGKDIAVFGSHVGVVLYKVCKNRLEESRVLEGKKEVVQMKINRISEINEISKSSKYAFLSIFLDFVNGYEKLIWKDKFKTPNLTEWKELVRDFSRKLRREYELSERVNVCKELESEGWLDKCNRSMYSGKLEKLICDLPRDQREELTKEKRLERVDELINESHLSNVLLQYLAAYQKGEFNSYRLKNGEVVEWFYDYKKAARLCLSDHSKENAERIFNQMVLASMLRLFAKYALSDFGEFCYQYLVENVILSDENIRGEGTEKEITRRSREKYIENFDRASLCLSQGHCDKMMFFTISGNKNLMVEKKDSQILLDGIDEIVGAARRDRPCLRQETTIVDGQRPSTKIIVADSRGYTQNLKKDKTPDHL